MGRRRDRSPPAAPSDACPCGLPADYATCCGPLHAGAAAPTAERLMRSRYSAWARGDASYLLASWHPSTRPRTVEVDPDLRWTGLEVLEARGGLLDPTGEVRFRATCVRSGVRTELREHSRFGRDGGRWSYIGPVP